MIIKYPLDVCTSLDDGGSQVVVAANDKKIGLSLETLQSETLVAYEVGMAVLRLAKRGGDVLGEVRGTVADRD